MDPRMIDIINRVRGLFGDEVNPPASPSGKQTPIVLVQQVSASYSTKGQQEQEQ
jgi:hypothetical protein